MIGRYVTEQYKLGRAAADDGKAQHSEDMALNLSIVQQTSQGPSSPAGQPTPWPARSSIRVLSACLPGPAEPVRAFISCPGVMC